MIAATHRWVPVENPLPREPPAPFAYLADIRVKLDQEELSRLSQREILEELRNRLHVEVDEEVRSDICLLVRALGERADAVRTTWEDVNVTLSNEASRRAAKG